jgi:hypothetical protein
MEPSLLLIESSLENLVRSVKNLNKNDIEEINIITSPSPAVAEVMAAVMIYLGKGTSWKEI